MEIILTQSWNRDIKWLELAENPSLKSYCGKFFFSVIKYHFKKKKKEEYTSAFNNNTSHFIQEEKKWKLWYFFYGFGSSWAKQNSEEKSVLLWGSLNWFSFGPKAR